jgi:hypothetical protein
MKPEKPYNGGKWTVARMRSFAMSAVRRAQWPAKYQSLSAAYVKDGTNPATGKPCKLHRCAIKGTLHPKKDMHADHKEPVIPLSGKWGTTTEWLGYNWNELLPRLWCEAHGYQAISKSAHKEKTKDERGQRKSLTVK